MDDRQHFLYLEIHDRDFNAFYSDFVHVVEGQPPKQRPHLTLRGPYRNPLGQSALKKYREAMQFAVLKIGGLGHFRNPGKDVVFLDVDSPHVRDIWWKPNYPIGEYGFHPHITLYQGSNTPLAEALASFAPLSQVTFLCAEFELVPWVEEREVQSNMPFSPLNRAPDHQRLEQKGVVATDFFQQLTALVEAHPGAE